MDVYGEFGEYRSIIPPVGLLKKKKKKKKKILGGGGSFPSGVTIIVLQSTIFKCSLLEIRKLIFSLRYGKDGIIANIQSSAHQYPFVACCTIYMSR